MEKANFLNIPIIVSFDTVDFQNILDLYNKSCHPMDRISVASAVEYRALVVKNSYGEIVGGFLFSEKRTLEKELSDIYGFVKNVYVTGLVKHSNSPQDVFKALQFLISKTREMKRRGYLVWGLVSDKKLMEFYKQKGFKIVSSENKKDKYSMVIF